MEQRQGRPPKPPEQRRTRTLKIPVTEAEHSAITRAALAAGLNCAAWARTLLIKAARRNQKS